MKDMPMGILVFIVATMIIADMVNYFRFRQLRRRISAILQRRFDNAFIVEQSPEKSSLYAELIDVWKELNP